MSKYAEIKDEITCKGLMLKLRQPAALKPLLFTQSLERVGGVLLLILITTYLTQTYGMDDQSTFNLVGSFGALSMAGYLAGGFLSDRVLGYRTSILWGCLLLCIGYLLLTIKSKLYLYAGLSFACIGNSLFMPSLSGFVSEFFYERDPRRTRAFIWLYMSMNVGALIAAVIAGVGLAFYGWTLTFYFSAVACMIAGLVFLLNKKNYENRGLAPRECFTKHPVLCHMIGTFIILTLLTLVFFLLQHLSLNSLILYILAIVVLAALLIASFYESEEKRYRLIRVIVLIIFSVIFWGLCSQEYLVVPLFISREVGVLYSNIETMAPIYFALNACLVAIFCPILAAVWRRLHAKRNEPSPGTKIALSLLSLGVAMTTLTIGSIYPGGNMHVSAAWVFSSFIFFALGESLLYPTGLSLTTLLAPRKWRGLLVALWFMTVGMGFLFATKLGKLAVLPGHSMSLYASKQHYAHAFAHYAIVAYSAGILLLLLMPVIKRYAPIHLQGTSEH
jgi:proton-dependent oligopeptide transporter, POT family